MKSRDSMKNRFAKTVARPRFGAECLKKLHDLKEGVVAELSSRFEGMLDEHQLRQVINEADALAATTPFPALFLPTLAEEKVRSAAHWQARQRELFERSLTLRGARRLPLAA
jgi:hypothetical protein